MRTIYSGYLVTGTATGLVAFGTSDLNGRPLSRSGLSVDQALVSSGKITAPYTNRVQLVDSLSNREKLRNRAKWFPPEVHVRARDDDTHTPIGKGVDDSDNTLVQKLGLINGHHLGIFADLFCDLHRSSHRNRFKFLAVMSSNTLNAPIAIIEMGLEYLDPTACNQRTPHSAKKLLGLAAEHHPGDNLHPTLMRPVKHPFPASEPRIPAHPM